MTTYPPRPNRRPYSSPNWKTDVRYQTVAYCVDSGCRCDHRAGVVLYDGPSRADAERTAAESPYTGYHVEVIRLEGHP